VVQAPAERALPVADRDDVARSRLPFNALDLVVEDPRMPTVEARVSSAFQKYDRRHARLVDR
jgi:hypothetical protein